jgi:hypothetical protein
VRGHCSFSIITFLVVVVVLLLDSILFWTYDFE